VNTFADEVEIVKKKFKTLEAAQRECENHLTKTYKQFQKFIDSNTYE
jgi:prefoldin subunit 5